MSENISVKMEASKNRSAAYDGGKEIGCCMYIRDGGTLTVTHTEVDSNYGGRGIARRLLDEVVGFARSENAKIVPACSYVEHVFERDPSYGDVWKKQKTVNAACELKRP
jgi:predicted GNAT family acetyltransferase